MNLYISDLHFGHTNVIKFDQRPFADRDEMDQTMIQLWNSRVSADDDVYIVGDFCHKSDKSPDWYLRKLRGHKHLIVGNHDSVTLNCEEAARRVSVKQIINGKMYNTETAQEIGCDSNGMNLDNLWFVEETLYRKQNGEFFLDGHDGPLSRYSRPNGSFSRCGAAPQRQEGESVRGSRGTAR